MTTYAQVYDGMAHNPVSGDPKDYFAADWLANHPPFIKVPDGTLHGAIDNGDGTFTNPVPEKPQPNTPNNPYFGKTPLIPKLFWGLVLQTYIALANGDKGAALDRQGRLLTSKRAQAILKVADSVDKIDPDDKDGDFLSMANLLTTVNHEDGKLLIEVAEFGAIMAAWK